MAGMEKKRMIMTEFATITKVYNVQPYLLLHRVWSVLVIRGKTFIGGEKKEKEGKHILIYLSSKLRENYYDLILKK